MKKEERERINSAVLIEEEEGRRDVVENRDPLSGERESHPVGVAAGGTGGAAAGTAIGTAIGGPVGGLIGAAAGAIAGGLAGKGIAETVNPSEEEQHWREYYKTRPYYESGREYETYAPGYKYGWESASRPEFRGKRFEEVESQLLVEWPNYHTTGEFSDYKDAARDAYERVQGRYETRNDLDENEFFDKVRRHWLEFKHSVRSRWDRVTDQDVDESQGRREALTRRIQERYTDDMTFDKDAVPRQLDDITRKYF